MAIDHGYPVYYKLYNYSVGGKFRSGQVRVFNVHMQIKLL